MKKPTKTDESKKLARYATEVAERVEKIRALLKWNTPDQVKDGWPDLATLVDEVVHANEMLKGAGDGEQEEEA